MTNLTKIGEYEVRDDGEQIHVKLSSGRVAVLGGDLYRAFYNKVYAALNVGTGVAVDALDDFLKERGVHLR